MAIGIIRRNCYPETFFELGCEIANNKWYGTGMREFILWNWKVPTWYSGELDITKILIKLRSFGWKVSSSLQPYLPQIIEIDRDLIYRERGSDNDQEYISAITKELKEKFGLECHSVTMAKFEGREYIVLTKPGETKENIQLALNNVDFYGGPVWIIR